MPACPRIALSALVVGSASLAIAVRRMAGIAMDAAIVFVVTLRSVRRFIRIGRVRWLIHFPLPNVRCEFSRSCSDFDTGLVRLRRRLERSAADATRPDADP